MDAPTSFIFKTVVVFDPPPLLCPLQKQPTQSIIHVARATSNLNVFANGLGEAAEKVRPLPVTAFGLAGSSLKKKQMGRVVLLPKLPSSPQQVAFRLVYPLAIPAARSIPRPRAPGSTSSFTMRLMLTTKPVTSCCSNTRFFFR